MAQSRSDQAQVWREQLATAFGQLRAEGLGQSGSRTDTEPNGSLSVAGLGRAFAFRVSGTPQIVRRTKVSVSQAPADPLKVCIQQAGTAVIHQGPHEIVLHPGEMALYDTGRPYDLRLEGEWSCAVLTVPRDLLGIAPRAVSDAMSHRWQAGNGPVTALAQLIGSSIALPTGTGTGHLGEASLHLLAGIIGGGPLADSEEDLRSRIVTYVHAHLREPGLDHGSIAAAHGISSRTLSRVFASEPESVVEMVRRLRLEAIHRDLMDTVNRHRAMAAVAAGWGFPDSAHFTRAFRAQFGVTPGTLRRTNRA